MNQPQARDLFQLQTDLIDAKVDMAVSKAIDRVLDRIDNLDRDMNQRFAHLEGRFTSLEHRVQANEKSLLSLQDTLTQIRNKFINHGVKSIWVISSTIVLYVSLQLLNLLIK